MIIQIYILIGKGNKQSTIYFYIRYYRIKLDKLLKNNPI